jgi:Tfp pilus assembly protein PilX
MMESKAVEVNTMGNHGMISARLHNKRLLTASLRRESGRSKGFTLIASLLMLLLLSGIAIGLMMMVNTEGKVGGTDLQNNVAYRAAEGGIEKMAADLSHTFQNSQAPTASQICAVGNNPPSMVGVTFTQYSVMPGSAQAASCPSTITANWGQLSGGPDQGLWAQIIPVNMLATAATLGGQEVSMIRTAQVALIPVFQFGVFSESDLSFFSGPNFDMAGPIHTNGDLYPFVGPGSTLTFHNQVSAYGNVIRYQLANGYNPTTNYNGTVTVPTANNGCSPPVLPATAASYPPTGLQNCAAMDAPRGSYYGDASVVGAGGTSPSTYNTSYWPSFSNTTTVHEMINGNYGSLTTPGTGAKKLSMPFVGGGAQPFQIIRRPPASEAATSSIGQSREYNLAQIRVLLSDDPADLPGGAADANNVRLANVAGSNPNGIAMTAGNYPSTIAAPPASNTYNLYFAAASNAVPLPSTCAGITCTSDWPYAPATPLAAAQTLVPKTPAPGAPIYLNNGNPTINVCPPANTKATLVPPGCPATGAYPYYQPPNANGATLYNSSSATSWNLIDGWLRVEYKDASGNWHPATNEWLQLGFARGLKPPTLPGSSAPTAGTNPVNPNAILLLQEPADRNGDGNFDTVGAAPTCTSVNGSGKCIAWTGAPPQVVAESGQWFFGVTPAAPTTQSLTQYNWYPINFYDAREGEVRDNTVADNSCSTNGVMNAVEIDVGNLKRWLAGTIGTNGASVDYLAQNGYVLYFSDRRGMLPNPNVVPPNPANTKTGDSGLEDVINASGGAGTPDGVLETPTANSPEDVNGNGVLDTFGTANLGLGFTGTAGSATQNLNGLITGATPDDPFGTAGGARIASCSTTARKNWVSGARHVLRLVDGSLGNVPKRTDAAATLAAPGGFTAASENPVYVLGDYNSNSTDTVWNTPPVDIAGHAAASVIADAVTFLSSNWSDHTSLGIGGDGTVTNPGNRNAGTNFYRLAVAGGKNMNFPRPTSWGAAQDFGTDGGVHNFLRYLENWGGTLNYKGSIVSLYYATYNTGIYKCCTTVYSPPTRNYSFDLDFTSPGGLPPGTPMFRDVESLGFRQLFATRKSGE